MFLSWVGPRSLIVRSSLALTCQYACSERQMPPGSQTPSRRAAILTPSPMRSPSLSSTTSADPEFNTAILGDACVALDHRVLHFDGAAHRIDYTSKFDQRPIAGALEDTSIMHGDCRIDEIASQGPQPRQCAILVRSCEPTETDHVGGENRRELPFLRHWSLRHLSNLAQWGASAVPAW